jgi:hypothetical protein
MRFSRFGRQSSLAVSARYNSTGVDEMNLKILCPHCKAWGKTTMFFANYVDLRAHVPAWHEGSE